jgi:NNP family nitrate/nitrite transporter-like MFS transporter
MIAMHLIRHWNPDDPVFWRAAGERVARRNLWLSVVALTLAFAVWMSWPVVVARLPAAGFRFSTEQLYWLAALPALSGATLRFVYAFAVPVFGGRRFTVWATASLLLPALGTGLAVQNPATPYELMLALALLCGLGGANFASSMAHISFFYPKASVGTALGLNAGLGNLGVPLALLLVPIVIGTGAGLGTPQATGLWLQHAGYVWLPLILVATLAAWFGMNDLQQARGSFAEQALIFRRRHNWLMCWLYIGTFGSFIGLAAALPLLVGSEYPQQTLLHLLWLGPLAGALSRTLGGHASDRLGGARVTQTAFVAMALGAAGVIVALPAAGAQGRLGLLLASLLLLFVAAGVGNGSTFRMIALIFRNEPKEAAAVLGFASAVGAYGGFFIPKAVGSSIAFTGGAQAAFAVFALFYLSCLGLTWWFYGRRHAPMPC